MEQHLRDKLSKIYELVNRGATEGERAAAQKALDRILDKYKIDEDELAEINFKTYSFKYTTNLELILLNTILDMMVENGVRRSVRRPWAKEIISRLNYMQWVTVETSYEYFRRHMKKEWNRVCLPEVNKARKLKNKNARRAYYQDLFIIRYLIESNLYKPENLRSVTPKSDKEMNDRMKLNDVEGGTYNRQIITNKLLN